MADDAGTLLVRHLATGLYVQAQAYVRAVMEGHTEEAPTHLVGFIQAQRLESGEAPTPELFQLPEPILGPIPDKVQVLVVGLNPGFGQLEEIPTRRSSLDEYVAWYVARMDRRDDRGCPVSQYAGRTGIVRHYVGVERDYLTPVLGERALGRVAVYADAIPWKWNRDSTPPLRAPQIGLEVRARIGSIAGTLRPDLLLVFGGEPAKQLSTPWPSDELTVSDVLVSEWRGRCLAVWHPNKHWLIPGQKNIYLARVHTAMRQALHWAQV